MASEKTVLVVVMVVAIGLATVGVIWWRCTQFKSPERVSPRLPIPVSEDKSLAGAHEVPEVRELVLELPRDPQTDEAVFIRVSVGALPPGAKVIVRTDDGEIVGAISPFGADQRESGGMHSIPVPRQAVHERKVKLCLGVLDGPDRASRPPTLEEVTDVQITIATVTPTDPQSN